MYRYSILTLTKEISLPLAIALILMLPYLHTYVPKVDGLSFWLFRYHSGFNQNIQVSLYFLATKFSYFLLLYIWFVTCPFWWRYGILGMVGLNLFQFIAIINADMPFFEDYTTIKLIFYITIPLMIPLTLFSNYVNYNSVTNRKARAVSFDKLVSQTPSLYRRYQRIMNDIQSLKKIGNKDLLFLNLDRLALSSIKNSKQKLFEPSNHKTVAQRFSEIFLFSILVLMPALYYFYLLIPSGTHVIDLGFFKIDGKNFIDVKTYIWVISMKFFLLIPLSIWFLTCTHWWKFSVLIPITILLYQITTLLKPETTTFDKYELWFAIPIILPLIIFMIWLSLKFKYFLLITFLENEIVSEINEITREMYRRDQQHSNQILLDTLIASKNQLSKEEYIRKLALLKKQMQEENEKKSRSI